MQVNEKRDIIMGNEITRRRKCYQHSTPPLTKRKGEFRMGASNSIPAQLPLPIEGEIVEIRLSNGDITIVDAVDADLLQLRWQCHTSGHNSYATHGSKKHSFSMHRHIMARVTGRPLVKGEIVDHINGNSLDNRRNNLRLCTHAQNIHNQRLSQRNTSGYKGVSYITSIGKWRAQIKVNRKQKTIGTYDTPEEAHAAYCEAAKKYFGEFARLA